VASGFSLMSGLRSAVLCLCDLHVQVECSGLGAWVRRRAASGWLVCALSGALMVGLLPAFGGVAAARAPAAELNAPQPQESERGSAPLSEGEAFAEAERTGELVEVVAMRGESSEVFATPEGNLEAREYLAPVWARVGGEWKTVDTALVAGEDGSVTPQATTVGLTFSGGGSEEPLVRMERAGRELALSWPGELPTPQLEGDTATYADVIPGVDVRMGAREAGFTQLVVVKTAEAANRAELAELRLALSAKGMEVRETTEGGLEAIDEGAKNAVFEAATPLMWDSSGGGDGAQPLTAEEETPLPRAGETGKLAEVGVEVDAGQSELTLTPDVDVLRGSDTEYPVLIDPQWYSPQASAWTFVSKYWHDSPQWKFNGDANAGMGYCGWDGCAPKDVKRLMYRIPTSKFQGKSVLSAEFVVRNVHSASCTARQVELWRTQGISTATTWDTQQASGFWIERLAQQSFAYGYDGCAAKVAEFGGRSAVQEAADKGWATMPA
jgi:hypothetical protein